MARGILSRRGKERLKSTVWGGAWGLVIGGVIVAVASQLAVRHDLRLPQPEARAVETPAGTEFVQERPETEPEVPGEETVPAADVAAVTPAMPEPADGSPSFDTSPAAAPEPAVANPAGLERPDVPGGADVALTAREGLRPETAGAPEARAPLPPRTDRLVQISRDVPAPPVREAAPEPAEAATRPVTETAELAPPVEDTGPAVSEAGNEPAATQPPPEAPVAATDGAAPAPSSAPERVVTALETGAPSAPSTGAAPEAPDTTAEAAPAMPAPAAPAGEVPGTAPDLAREPTEAPAEPDVPEAAGVEVAEADRSPATVNPAGIASVAPEPEEEPTIPENPQLADAGAAPSMIEPRRIRQREGGFRMAQAPQAAPDMPGVPSASIGRRVGSLPGSRVEAENAPAVAAPIAREGAGALAENREPFDATDGRARLAVVLVHESAAPPDLDALARLPAEVSFAVDGGSANAAEIAAAYRSAGREVVLIPSIPAGAQPQDVEVALAANLGAVDEAVAVMDPGTAGFQGDRAAVGQVIAVIADTGHGLITAPRGLNTAQQIAGRFDVPSALIFDDLGPGTDAGAVSRALDRAAFRARQEEGVILLGRADAATIEGLGDWLQGRNAQSLALAPVSAVLDPSGAATAEDDEAESRAADDGLPRVRTMPGTVQN